MAEGALMGDTRTHDTSDAFITLTQIVLTMFSGTNFVAYLFIIVCIIKHPALQVITNYFLFSTGVAHILFQATCLSVTFYARKICAIPAPMFVAVLELMAFAALFWNTMLVAMETFLKVCHPFYYARVMTDRKCFALIGLTWAACSLVAGVTITIMATNGKDRSDCPLGLIMLNEITALRVFLDVTFVPSLITLTVTKVLILRTARSQARRIVVLDRSDQPGQQQNDSALNEERKIARIQRKSTINFAIFAGTYIFAWTPIVLFFNIYSFNQVSTAAALAPPIVFVIVGNLTSIGPLVYTLRQAEFVRLRMLYWQRLRVYVRGPPKEREVQVRNIRKETVVVADVETPPSP